MHMDSLGSLDPSNDEKELALPDTPLVGVIKIKRMSKPASLDC